MSSRRRKVSSDLSAAVVEYVLKKTGMSQEALAEALEVSPGFISRLRGKERSLTIDHLELMEDIMHMPLGALLLIASPPPPPRPETAKLHELCRQAMLQADIVSEKLKALHLARANQGAVS